MVRKMKHRLAAGAGAALAVAGGGAAIAATQLSPKAESEAVVNDAAKQLGVTPAKLSDALKQALSNRVDAAVAAGTMTKAQGDQLKARIAAGEFPLFGVRGPGFGHGEGGPHGGFDAHLSAAATYLAVTEAELRTSLEGGKTLADVAKEKGKSTAGLVNALVADETKELDAAVTAGRLTKAQRDALVTNAKQRFQDLVDGKAPARGSFRDHDGFRGGPPGADDDSGYRFDGERIPAPPAA